MAKPLVSKPQPEAIPLNIYVGHLLFPFFLPHFPGAPKSEGVCSQGEWLHSGREPDGVEGGTGKAKLRSPQGAGIRPKQCPGKWEAEKRRPCRIRGGFITEWCEWSTSRCEVTRKVFLTGISKVFPAHESGRSLSETRTFQNGHRLRGKNPERKAFPSATECVSG